jgi:microcystin-dependent protein
MDSPFMGIIMAFAGNFAPQGWMSCEGQLLPISTNTALFAILGTTYGGDGQVSFGLPDLRGRAAIGQGAGPGLSNYVLGQQAGTETTTLTIAQLPAHNHALALQANADGAATPDPTNGYLSIASSNMYETTSSAAMATQNNAAALAGGSQPFEILAPYLAMYQCIATEGLFPTRN